MVSTAYIVKGSVLNVKPLTLYKSETDNKRPPSGGLFLFLEAITLLDICSESGIIRVTLESNSSLLDQQPEQRPTSCRPNQATKESTSGVTSATLCVPGFCLLIT